MLVTLFAAVHHLAGDDTKQLQGYHKPGMLLTPNRWGPVLCKCVNRIHLAMADMISLLQRYRSSHRQGNCT